MNREQVIQVYNDDDMRLTRKSLNFRKMIGHTLATEYKGIPWRVDVNMDGGVATISSPLIDPNHKWGMFVHLDKGEQAIRATVKALAGELLERFRISRTTGMADHLNRVIDGSVVGLSKGEQ